MAVTFQSITIPFNAGLDLKSSPLLVNAPQLISCQNGIFTQGGTITKRNGYGTLAQMTRTVNPAYLPTPPSPPPPPPPGPVAGYVGWFKGDANVYSDLGTTPANNGDEVEQWNDQSSNGYNATQTTSADRPIYRTNSQNGLPGLEFSGGSQVLLNTSGSFSQPNTIFVVFNPVTLSTTFCSLFDTGNGNGANRNGIAITTSTGSGNYLFAGSLAYFGGSTGAFPQGTPALVTATFNGASSDVWNGNTSVATNLNPGTYPLTGFGIGGTSFGAGSLDTIIYEVIVYNSLLSGPNITTVQNYLIGKWGL